MLNQDETRSGAWVITGNTIANGKVITPAELGYVAGLTSDAQTQITAAASAAATAQSTADAKAPVNHASTAETYGLATRDNYGHVRQTSPNGVGTTSIGTSSAANYVLSLNMMGNTTGDLNNYRTPGEWYWYTNPNPGVLTNAPTFTDAPGAGLYLKVYMGYSTTDCIQECWARDSQQSWIRDSTSATSWTPWRLKLTAPGVGTASQYLRGDQTWGNPFASPALTGTPTAPNVGATAYNANPSQIANLQFVADYVSMNGFGFVTGASNTAAGTQNKTVGAVYGIPDADLTYFLYSCYITFAAGNTADQPTLKIGSLAALPIVTNTVSQTRITANQLPYAALLQYNISNFILLNPAL